MGMLRSRLFIGVASDPFSHPKYRNTVWPCETTSINGHQIARAMLTGERYQTNHCTGADLHQ